MVFFVFRLFLAFSLAGIALSAPAAWAAEAGDTAKIEVMEAMEVGGRITVDGQNNFHQWENTPATLGHVELSAMVHVHENMEGAITLLSQNDPGSIAIDQAVGQWTLGAGQIIFGQQYFNLGLLTTRLIRDPLIVDAATFQQAGVTGLWTREWLTLGLGISSLATGPDSAQVSDPCFIVNADVAPGNQVLRLATQISRERLALDGAFNLNFGPILLDAEAIWRFSDEQVDPNGGYNAGLTYPLNAIVSMSVRWDAMGDLGEALRRQRMGGGITITLIEQVFGAVEVDWDKEMGFKGQPLFAVQMGLRSAIKLPGFQRKTLVN